MPTKSNKQLTNLDGSRSKSDLKDNDNLCGRGPNDFMLSVGDLIVVGASSNVFNIKKSLLAKFMDDIVTLEERGFM